MADVASDLIPDSDSDPTVCHYCNGPLGHVSWLRPVGIHPDEPRPILKTWCGACDPGDLIDPGALLVLRRTLTRAN